MNSNPTDEQLIQLYMLEQTGRFQKASEGYEQLLTHSPEHPGLLWGLGRCMMHFGWRNRAAQLLQQAVAAYPSHPDMMEDVIKRLNLVGNPKAALSLCEEAEKRFPERRSINLHRVDALRLLDRHEEAIPPLRELAKSPAAPVGTSLRLIACLRQTGNAREAVQLATQTLSEFDGSLLDKAGILNEMAHAQESLGQYQAAFDSFCTSGEIAMRSQEAQLVDAQIYPRLVSRQLVSLESRGLATPPDYSAGDYPRLAFQVGFPRSGTTLVESVLAAHQQVQTSGEVPFFSAAQGILLASGLPMETLLEEIPRQPISLLERARKAYWDKVRSEHGSELDVFVDKQPMNIMFLAQIRLLFPEAKIIFCERDPREVCLSCFFTWFQINSSNKNFLGWHDTAEYYRQVMEYWLALRPLLGDAAYTIRYETFVANYRYESEKLFDFLQLEMEWDMLKSQRANRENYFHTPSNRAIQKPVKATASPRWHHYPDAIEQIRPLLRPLLSALGY